MITTLYPSADGIKKGRDVPMLSVLRGIQSGRWRQKVELVRRWPYGSKEYKAAKVLVPAFTACATFAEGKHDMKSLASVTGVVAMDFDPKENPDILARRPDLEADPHTWVCSLSLGGHGLFVLVPVGCHAGKDEWFDDLRDYYRVRYGLDADKSCRDVTRYRFVSFDPALYCNPAALVFHPVPLLQDAPRSWSTPNDPTSLAYFDSLHLDGIDTSFDLAATVEEVVRAGVDLTADYFDWVGIGMALGTNLGEAGRGLFHRLSSLHPDYKPAACDKKYNAFVNKPSRAGLGKIYYLVRQAGMEPVKRTRIKSNQ